MANSWGKCGNSVRFYFLGPKVIVDGDCSHEIKRRLLFRRKAMTNLDSILKGRDIMLLANVRIVKAMVFPTWFFNSQDLRVELQRRLSTKELMLSNCGVGEDS